MNFFYGNSEEFSITLDKTDYLYYVYKNITDIAGLLLWLNDTNVPPDINTLYIYLYKLNASDLLPGLIQKFPIFVEAYLNVRMGHILKKLIIPYKVDAFPATSFIIQNLETVYFLYDIDKLNKFFGSFTMLHSLYTKNIDRLIPDINPTDEALAFQSIKHIINDIENPYQRNEILTKNLIDSLVNNSFGCNSNSLKTDISKITHQNASFVFQSRIPNFNTDQVYQTDNMHTCLPNILRAVEHPHLIILLSIFNLFETALVPVFTTVAEDVTKITDELRATTRAKLSNRQKIEMFTNSFNIQFESKIKKTGTW